MHQHGWLLLSLGIEACCKQEAIGGAAALEGVFEFEAQPLGAEAPQADQSIAHRQVDHLTGVTAAGLLRCGGHRAHHQ